MDIYKKMEKIVINPNIRTIEKMSITGKPLKIMATCCECKHFRMWKPKKCWCTIKKVQVKPLDDTQPCFELRKNLRVVF